MAFLSMKSNTIYFVPLMGESRKACGFRKKSHNYPLLKRIIPKKSLCTLNQPILKAHIHLGETPTLGKHPFYGLEKNNIPTTSSEGNAEYL